MSERVVSLPNSHLKDLNGNLLFHLDIALDKRTLSLFKNVKFVCVGGTASRMEELALHMADELKIRVGHVDNERFDYVSRSDRFSGFLVGPVFCVNHGMGTPSASILLQEVFKLLMKAGSSDVTLLRIGTCGGIGVPPGTIAISTGALSPGLKPVFRTSRLGSMAEYPITVDRDLAEDIYNLGTSELEGVVKLVKGKTYCADDFYQAQGRFDGAFCDYSQQERMEFFKQLQSEGVVNIEMESACVLALSHRAGIKAGVVCAVLINRLESDQVDMSQCPNVLKHLLQLVSKFIRRKLGY